jgi:Icc-related predicted phosphoesterase
VSGNVRVYYCCDVHGSEVCFRKVLNAVKFNIYKSDAVLVSGDLTGKALFPVLTMNDGTYQIEHVGGTETIKSVQELAAAERRMWNMGYYTYHTTSEERDALRNEPQKLQQLFTHLIYQRIEEWVRIAEDRLKGISVSFFMMPGNDDPPQIGDLLRKSDRVINPEGTVTEVGGHEMISTGWSNPTPWRTYRECTEEELHDQIDRMAASLKNPAGCIFNLHVPPYNSTLDSAPKLDENMRMVVDPGSGGPTMIPVGSTAVREAIEKHQPMLGLHGHVHESAGHVTIGRTLCLNPGSEYNSGMVRGYIVDLEHEKVKRYQLAVG